ncbi:MAG: RNA pseudouridine synthase [Planctomycetota bacterium]
MTNTLQTDAPDLDALFPVAPIRGPEEPPLLCVRHLAPTFALVEKPAGLHSVPGRTEDKFDSVRTRAETVFPDASGPLIVHRLDLDTSGLMVIGLNPEAHSKLSRQFMHRKVGKTYIALLDGDLQGEPEGTIELPLTYDEPDKPRHRVDFMHGRPSRSLYRVTWRGEWGGRPVTLVEFRPETGRTHQLRLHAACPRTLPGDAYAWSATAGVIRWGDERLIPPNMPPKLKRQGKLKSRELKREREGVESIPGGLGLPILGDPLYSTTADAAPRLMLHADFLAFWDLESDAWLKFGSKALPNSNS